MKRILAIVVLAFLAFGCDTVPDGTKERAEKYREEVAARATVPAPAPAPTEPAPTPAPAVPIDPIVPPAPTEPPPPPTTAEVPPTGVIIGDSVLWTLEVPEGFTVDLSVGRGPTYNPYSYQGQQTGIDSVKTWAEVLAPTDALVIQDDGTHEDYDSYSKFVQETNAIVRPENCIVWLTPWTADRRSRDEEIVRAIEDNFTGHRAVVAHWDLLAEAGLVSDGSHPTAEGGRLLAEMIVTGVKACP